jgi:hypothetical protein
MRLALVVAVVATAFLGNAAAAHAYQCYDVTATIVGTKADDELHGTNGRDVIVGLGGDDVIRGLDDADRLCGNGGDDKIIAGAGVDQVDGGTGRNVLNGGNGDDRLYGGPSTDSFWPGLGNDVVDGRGTPDREWVHYDTAHGPVSVDLDTGHATGEGTDILVAIHDIAGSRFGDIIVKGDEYDNVLRLGKGKRPWGRPRRERHAAGRSRQRRSRRRKRHEHERRGRRDGFVRQSPAGRGRTALRVPVT